MNLQMVLINLDRMIAGKEQELAEAIDMKQSLSKELDAYKELYMHWETISEMLRISIPELKRLRADLLLVRG
jgi:hypothetical protein